MSCITQEFLITSGCKPNSYHVSCVNVILNIVVSFRIGISVQAAVSNCCFCHPLGKIALSFAFSLVLVLGVSSPRCSGSPIGMWFSVPPGNSPPCGYEALFIHTLSCPFFALRRNVLNLWGPYTEATQGKLGEGEKEKERGRLKRQECVCMCMCVSVRGRGGVFHEKRLALVQIGRNWKSGSSMWARKRAVGSGALGRMGKRSHLLHHAKDFDFYLKKKMGGESLRQCQKDCTWAENWNSLLWWFWPQPIL